MKHRYDQFNQKRRLKVLEDGDVFKLTQLAKKVKYGGNPEHKKNPGDFSLTPPSGPRLGESLCDDVDIFERLDALKLLKSGLGRGLVSDRFNGEWPKNIWSVTGDGKPVEAQLENSALGSYHGYPMPESDPLGTEVLRRWKNTDV